MKIAITFHPARPVTTPLAQSNVASSFNARLTTRQPKMVYIKCTRIVYETFSPNENGIWIGTILSIIVFSFRVKNIICRQTKYYIYKKEKKKKKGRKFYSSFVIYHSRVPFRRYFPWQYFSRLTTLFGISPLCVSENCKFSSLIPLRKYCNQMEIVQSESRTLFPCILDIFGRFCFDHSVNIYEKI